MKKKNKYFFFDQEHQSHSVVAEVTVRSHFSRSLRCPPS